MLGDVRFKQGLMSDSFHAYHQALLNFQTTIGYNHNRTAQVCIRLAEFHMKNGELEDAR